LSQPTPFFNQLQIQLKEMFDKELEKYKEQCDKYFQRNLQNLDNNLYDETVRHSTNHIMTEHSLIDVFNKIGGHDLLLSQIRDNLQYLVTKINKLDAEPKLKTYVGATPDYNHLASWVEKWIGGIDKRINNYEMKPKMIYNDIQSQMDEFRTEKEQFFDIVDHIKKFEKEIEQRVKDLEKTCSQ